MFPAITVDRNKKEISHETEKRKQTPMVVIVELVRMVENPVLYLHWHETSLHYLEEYLESFFTPL